MSTELLVLFDSSSVNLDSRIFQVNHQRTVIAVGMEPDDFITFEVVLLGSGTPSSVCGCYITQMQPGVILGVEELKCPACESQILRPVRLTDRNPVAVLDVPQGVLVRAIYHGTGINLRTVTVHAYATNTPNLTDAMRGCPPVCCEDEPQTWRNTGEVRCDETNNILYRIEISNCGNIREVSGPGQSIPWTATGRERCRDDNVQIQEQNPCGTTRWTIDRPIEWTATGAERCRRDNVEIQEQNSCGTMRWTIYRPIEWIGTGQIRCQNGEVQRQEANQCGTVRWVFDRALEWVANGTTRCTNTTVEQQEQTPCGDLRWTILRAVEWQYNCCVRCTDSTFEQQQANDCGRLRWEQQAISWTPTGLEDCLNASVFRQERNQCGTLRWINTGESCAGFTSDHTITSIVAVGATITEGQLAQWTVTLNTPVSGAALLINFTLGGTEQAARSYPAPNLIIPIGASSGVVSAQTFDDLTIEATLALTITAVVSSRVTAVPAASSINVLDNDSPTGDSTHTVVCISPPGDITEGDTASWTVQLNSLVAGADLVITSTLSGTEQTIHGYPAPSVVIPIGQNTGVLSVITTDDATVESSQQLCLTVNTGARITAVNNVPCGA